MNKQLNGYTNQHFKLNKNKENVRVFLYVVHKRNYTAYDRDILVATIIQQGMDPVTPALEAWSLNHWTIREVPQINYF